MCKLRRIGPECIIEDRDLRDVREAPPAIRDAVECRAVVRRRKWNGGANRIKHCLVDARLKWPCRVEATVHDAVRDQRDWHVRQAREEPIERRIVLFDLTAPERLRRFERKRVAFWYGVENCAVATSACIQRERVHRLGLLAL